MSGFHTVKGFEDVWRPPVDMRRRTPEAALKAATIGATGGHRARLARIVARTPEVMVKIAGRTHDGGRLLAHLSYISRRGELEMEDREGNRLSGRDDVRALAEDWSAMAELDNRRRANTPVSRSIVLSMPARTDPLALQDAARAFAAETFADRFDYAFVLHTDAGHPHVHLAVRALGDQGERLNPTRADLEAWRQAFARALRERGVEAEATPRRTRGVTRKAERTPVRKLRERLAAGPGGLPRVTAQAYREAAVLAFGAPAVATPWELAITKRQAHVRLLYMSEARALLSSPDKADRALGRAVAAFVRDMPAADTQRLALARQLRTARTRSTQLDLLKYPARGRDR